ncbi:MarR family winged helix-turn-helix transcriptional regulator [Nocardia spumae]|uniref:MarR family winged helix-turn-helix transcriptional regulator n=1 Tax=Nocardia spumae TaxID=2887190 RepID=UPI001D14E919|nr:hypothetical protein [Nocardia spumae]
MTATSQSTHPRDEIEVPKPLGYWVKHIHDRLEDNLAAALRDLNLDRRSWQLLNTVAHGPVDSVATAAALAPFVGGRPESVAPLLTELADRGVLVADATGRYTLTAAGIQVRAQAADRVHAARAAIARGFSAEEFHTLLALLRRVAANADSVAARRK